MKALLNLLALVFLFLTGCAHIPRESVELSESIGTGMAEEHRAYIGMIHLYFDQKREMTVGNQ